MYIDFFLETLFLLHIYNMYFQIISSEIIFELVCIVHDLYCYLHVMYLQSFSHYCHVYVRTGHQGLCQTVLTAFSLGDLPVFVW
uniref:Uncharacterized protein n=1 Tax=Rhipicephalus pulchellus TaxID=72859 RepID=L7LVS0_RHIPC